MSNELIFVAIACFIVAGATLWFIFFVETDALDFAPHRSHLDHLLERRDQVYENLRDLRFEHRAGKFSEEDFEDMKRALEIEAARLIAEMDKLTGGVPTPATRQAMSERPQS